jgi:hypothetical protein
MLLYFVFGESRAVGGGLRGPEELLKSAKIPAESTWMGIYIGGSRIGYVHSELTPRADGGYEITELSRMAGAMMGAQQKMKMQMTVITDSALAMKSFEGEIDAAPYHTGFKGKHSNQVLSIELTAGGKTSERFIPAPEPLYLSQAIKPLLQAGRLGSGDSLRLSSFDPTSVEMQDLVIFGAAPEKQVIFGQSVVARKLVTRMGDFESSLYVDEQGNSIAELGPMGIVMRTEDMETALQVDDGGGTVDFLNLFAVKPTGKFIGDPRSVVEAKYRVSNTDVAQAIGASTRQRMTADSLLVVDATLQAPDSVQPAPEYTQDAVFIESRDPAVIKAAGEAVRGGTSRLDSLERLSQWVFKGVEKKPSAGLPSALAVLQTREGDCNEHSVLFTALARALKIPCKVELGVVYQNGRFYYHAWPAAWANGRWVEFEPTFGDRRADAARIALAAGDMSTASKLASSIGKIKIEIVETKSN